MCIILWTVVDDEARKWVGVTVAGAEGGRLAPKACCGCVLRAEVMVNVESGGREQKERVQYIFENEDPRPYSTSPEDDFGSLVLASSWVGNEANQLGTLFGMPPAPFQVSSHVSNHEAAHTNRRTGY